MSKTVLITRPRYDETTNYLYYFAEKVIKEAERKNFQIFDLKEKKANLRDFSGRMNKINPSLIFLNGHGNPDLITGHDGEVLLSVNKKESFLNDKIIYALSCSSAKKLGKFLITNGTKSFIGYQEDFIFIHEKNKSTRPIEDETAKLFLEPSNLIMTTLIKGNESKDAFERSQKEFNRSLRKLQTSESPQKDKSSIPWLLWDMQAQVCLGDQSAKI